MQHFKKATELLGYCCPFGYLTANTRKTTLEMSKELSVAPRTVRLWKHNLLERTVECKKNSTCPYRY